VSLSEIFENAFWKIYERNNSIWELLDALEDALKADPRACGEPHPDHANNGCWVYEFPSLARLPRASVLYQIRDDGIVMLWALRIT
jgi:hypothetical protein